MNSLHLRLNHYLVDYNKNRPYTPVWRDINIRLWELHNDSFFYGETPRGVQLEWGDSHMYKRNPGVNFNL